MANRAEIALLEKTQEDRHAIFGAQLVDHLVEDGRNVSEVDSGIILQRIHFGDLSFTGLTTALAAQDRSGHMVGMPMQPAAKHHLAGKCASHAGQVCKHSLCHVFGPMRVTLHHPGRYRIDEAKVTRHYLAKGWLGAGLHVFSEQFLAVRHRDFCIKAPPTGEIRQDFISVCLASPLEAQARRRVTT